MSADPRQLLTAEEKRATVIALYQRATYAASMFSSNPMLATSVRYVGHRVQRLQQMWEDLVGEKFITRRLRPFVESSMFICAVCGMIVFNAIFIGTTAHFTMQAFSVAASPGFFSRDGLKDGDVIVLRGSFWSSCSLFLSHSSQTAMSNFKHVGQMTMESISFGRCRLQRIP